MKNKILKYRRKRPLPVLDLPESKENESEKKHFLEKFISSESFLLAFFPIIIFLSSYAYQVGYFYRFGIPLQLASFDIYSIVNYLHLGVAYFLTFYFLLLAFIWYVTKKMKKVFLSVFLPCGAATLFVVFVFYYSIFVYKLTVIEIFTDSLILYEILIAFIVVLTYIKLNPEYNGSYRFNKEYKDFFSTYNTFAKNRVKRMGFL